MPGLVDAHVHVNEPGRTEWEGFAHATRAAAAGGVTTLADMPLNSDPVTTSVAALAAKQAAAEGQCWIDVGFHAGLVPANAARRDQILDLDARGVLAWKAFLCDSGLADFPASTRADLEAAMPVLAQARARLLVHAELATDAPAATASSLPGLGGEPTTGVGAGGDRAPDRALPHHGMRGPRRPSRGRRCTAVAARRRAPKDCRITVETCPHYLHFAAEDIPDGDARYKCAPPIRGRANREALWGALADGTIDLVASDHSPAPPALKTAPDGDFARAWGGIASIQLTLPVVWTGARARGLALERLAEWLCARPAELLASRSRSRRGRRRQAREPGGLGPRSELRGRSGAAPVPPSVDHALRGRTAPRSGGAHLGTRARGGARRRDPRRADGTTRRARRRDRRRPLRRTAAAVTRCASRSARPLLLGAGLDRRDARGSGGGHRRFTTLDARGAGLRPAAPRRLARSVRRPPAHRRPRQPAPPVRRSTAALAAAEQAGTRAASDRVLRALAQGNADYERRFGHIFIVCASGKSADEMLAILDQRLSNDPDVELQIAAGEQRKITRLRLASMA